jgi:hypothetical protein
MRAAAFIVLALGACAPAATRLPIGHPARADATPGRLAGPPAALRQGVSRTPDPVETTPRVDHRTHEGHP